MKIRFRNEFLVITAIGLAVSLLIDFSMVKLIILIVSVVFIIINKTENARKNID